MQRYVNGLLSVIGTSPFVSRDMGGWIYEN